jgi:DNA-directed RNA polymerase specialized sigma24 family protein
MSRTGRARWRTVTKLLLDQQLPSSLEVVLLVEMTWGKGTTDVARGAFEEEWPGVAKVLDRVLRGRRLAREQREDVIQETGLRLFSKWKVIDPDRPIAPFAVTIALNLLKDEARAAARREARPMPFVEMSSRGVEEEALARLELDRVAAALQDLTPKQRTALLTEIGAAMDEGRGTPALKMLRLRARRNLRTALERASAVAVLVGESLRRSLRSAGIAVGRSNAAENASALSLSTLGIAGVAGMATIAVGLAALPGVSLAPRPTSRPPLTRASSVVARQERFVSSGARASSLKGASRSVPVARPESERGHDHDDGRDPMGVEVGAGPAGAGAGVLVGGDELSATATAHGSVADRHAAVVVKVAPLDTAGPIIVVHEEETDVVPR